MLDLTKIQRALEMVESNGGRNSYPRFEAAYAPKGARFTVQGRIITGTGTAFNDVVKPRWDQFGMASACSFGAAQILYHTAADLGFVGHPSILWSHKATHDLYVRRRLDKIVARGADTLEKVADAWNSGTHKDKIIPVLYIEQVVKAYNLL